MVRLTFAAAVLCLPLAARAEKPEKAKAGPFTLLFVGGAGGDETSPTLRRLQARLAALNPTTTRVVFTGNYAAGELPPEADQGRASAERSILAHVVATEDFVKRGGSVYFLPGHRDYAGGGATAVRRLRAFLNHAYQTAIGDAEDDEEREIDVMPQAGCADSTLVELNDNIGLLLLDSEWWMEEGSTDSHANEGCEVKTRANFTWRLHDSLNAYRSRRLVVASHHPMQSYGEFGGSFTAGAHASPVPIIGSAWVFARQVGLVEQHQNHPMVRSYLDLLFEEGQRYGAYVFASGHDASLQYIKLDKQVQIVSGTSGREASPTVRAGTGDFAASTPGWTELELDAMGAGEARFVSGESDDAVLFRVRLPEVIPPGAVGLPPAAPFPEGLVTSTYTKEEVWHTPSLVKFLIGTFYSDAYVLKLPYQALKLQTEEGGMTPHGTGGGMQTNSLKLRDAQGAEWAARAVTKDSSRFLPWPQNQASFVNRVLDHGYTATHPEAALAVPKLAEAVGVLHAEPRLLYLPDQEELGRFRGYVTNEVVLLERKPKVPKEGVLPATLAGEPSPEGKTTFKTTLETIEKLQSKPAKHRVDQEAMLRARLLDLFMGDWDRHEGQWAFAVTPNADGTKTYRPIARDRDQAFANYDGLALGLARIATPMVRVLQPFNADYGNLSWLTYGARDIDAIFLNQIPRDRWLAIALEERDALTDEVIAEAFSTWHPEAYALDGERIVAALKIRREKLVDVADAYFKLVNHDADVVGSSRDDTFDLWFQPGGAVRVTVHGKHKDGTDQLPYFDRLFQPDQTAQLRIYGLDGDDTLWVHDDASTSIDIRFVGGRGADTVAATGGPGKGPLNARAITVYDADDGLKIDPSIDVRDERSGVARFNQYDPLENHEPNFSTFVPGMLINPDDGVFIGGKYTYTVHGYKKRPYAAEHDLTADFATTTLGASIAYRGMFPESLALLDQQLDLSVKTPTYSRNFYGLTNHTFGDAVTADYYRVRQARYAGRYGVSHLFADTRSRVGAEAAADVLVTEDTPGRFVDVSPDVPPQDLGPRYFAGLRVFAQTNTFDDLQLPKRGIALHVSAEGRADVAHGNQFSITYKAAGAVAIPFDHNRRFVLLTRAAIEGIIGDHPFYFAPTLGGGELRSYHFQQFAGDVAFSQTTDLRIDVFRIYSVIPGTVGINAAIDHGRVFGATIKSHEYHVSYGGGLWWSIMDVVGLSLNYYRGLEGSSRIVFAVGPLFSQTGF